MSLHALMKLLYSHSYCTSRENILLNILKPLKENRWAQTYILFCGLRRVLFFAIDVLVYNPYRHVHHSLCSYCCKSGGPEDRGAIAFMVHLNFIRVAKANVKKGVREPYLHHVASNLLHYPVLLLPLQSTSSHLNFKPGTWCGHSYLQIISQT